MDAVQKLIDEVLRPLVEADGGRLELLLRTDDEVVLGLRGACSGCPGSTYTTARVIEPALRTVLGPEVRVRFQVGVVPSDPPENDVPTQDMPALPEDDRHGGVRGDGARAAAASNDDDASEP